MKNKKMTILDELEQGNLDNIGGTVTEIREEEEQEKTKPKHLNAMPTAYMRAFEEGLTSGRVAGNFSQYIYLAVRDALLRDGLL